MKNSIFIVISEIFKTKLSVKLAFIFEYKGEILLQKQDKYFRLLKKYRHGQ